jgi:hypothetical protein
MGATIRMLGLRWAEKISIYAHRIIWCIVFGSVDLISRKTMLPMHADQIIRHNS